MGREGTRAVSRGRPSVAEALCSGQEHSNHVKMLISLLDGEAGELKMGFKVWVLASALTSDFSKKFSISVPA